MAEATYVQPGESIDYIPSANVAAGTVVVLGDLVGVTKRDIRANELGALALGGVYSDNLLAKGQAWLARMKQRHESCPVVYQRGSQFVELRATIGKTVFENENGAGGIVRFESRDFLVPPSKLVLNSAVQP